MRVLVINQDEVSSLLKMRECIDVMARTLSMLAAGKGLMPLRPTMSLPDNVGLLTMMPAYLADIKCMGLKAISVFPGNMGTPYDSHQGAVLLFEIEHGCLLAIVDATAITGIRTAAVSAVATKHLAQEGAGDLAILGAGVQARAHLEALLLVRRIRRVRVWSLPAEQAHQFAESESKRHGMKVEVSPNAEEAVRDADIICTVTSARKPVLAGRWISPGAHINAVGSSVAFTRELDTEAMVRSRLYVDRRESTINEAGDFLIPKKEGAIGNDHIQGEVGELILGLVNGRGSDNEITLFKSLGLAVEDLAAAHHVYKKAVDMNMGTLVELGGNRHATS